MKSTNQLGQIIELANKKNSYEEKGNAFLNLRCNVDG